MFDYQEYDFSDWMKETNRLIERNMMGMDPGELGELPGFFFHDYFDEGWRPEETANLWIELWDIEHERFFGDEDEDLFLSNFGY